MIPISMAPKRFTAALGRARFRRVPKKELFYRPSLLLQQLSFSTKFIQPVVNSNPAQKILGSSFSTAAVDDDDHDYRTSLVLEGDRDATWWTGKAPSQCAGYDRKGTLYSLPQITFHKGLTRDMIQCYFDNTWTLTEVMLGSLQGEASFNTAPYHELRHPLIFYYGHPAALYVNKLRVAGLMKAPINPFYEVIFETGVDEMSWDDLSKNKMQWPSVDDVHAYRKQVYDAVSTVIRQISDKDLHAFTSEGSDIKGSPLWGLFMAFEHERIHLETSSVLITELPSHLTKFPKEFPAYHASIIDNNKRPREALRQAPVAGVDYPVNDTIDVPAQSITLGKPHTFPSFGWDNEYGSRSYEVPAFKAAKYKTTNGEFYEFVKEGGYAKPEYWSEAGWRWRAFRNAKWPSFWVLDGPQGLHQFKLRLLFDEVAMKWDLPAAVNYHEALAFATWQSKKTGKHLRVLTELEHHAIRSSAQQLSDPQKTVDTVVQSNAVGETLMSQLGVNVNLTCSSMTPVTALPPNDKGFHDVFGNCWDWTSDYFSPLDGFEVHKYYEDFSTPCFDGLHHVIMGGSFISTGNEASIFSRYHFRPHFFQHASFRIAEVLDPQAPMPSSDTDAPGPHVGVYPFRRSPKNSASHAADEAAAAKAFRNSAESSKHFGQVSPAFGLPAALGSMGMRVEELVMNTVREAGIDLSTSNVLDIGCGRGGVVFSLAKNARFVMGIDHHQSDVDVARALSVEKKVSYTLRGEGGRVDQYTSALPSHVSMDEGTASGNEGDRPAPANVVIKGSVDFRCADPMCLPAELSGFDVCILSDVLDKVSSPGAVLSRMGGMRGMVRSGGVLLILSTFDWKESCTPKSLWLGSSTESPEDALRKRLSDDFTFLSKQDVPIYWQESGNDLRGKLYNATMWVRR